MVKGDYPAASRINWELVEQLCGFHCTCVEIAAATKVSVETLTEAIKRDYGISFPEYFAEKSASGKISLRKKQYNLASEGNATMLIWLGKNWLGQTDKLETKSESENNTVTKVVFEVIE